MCPGDLDDGLLAVLTPALLSGEGAMTDTNEISVADLRKNLAEILNDTAVRNRTIYVTRNGRRIAAIVPVPVAEQNEQVAA
ncbi:type II toxin-antitoxin system Phd/YefM family antitoxin [Micromonospora sp. DT62]|uniref:type II toxin-antitoxin system Phd/YefM family antitoxin n=1 Tax=Micromonospora sp. DT62 TaxID=3416521 RepID=UPI003CE97515